VVGSDCLVDTNIILRSADRFHPASTQARAALKVLFRRGIRLCVAKQSLLEAWVVATRPRDVNGFGYSSKFAAEGLSKVKRLFHVLSDSDSIYAEWERLAVTHQVLGKTAYDARLVATMRVHDVEKILTFNGEDFKRFPGIQVVHPSECSTG
jgi:predicted nucleic acid-binding protein